MPKAYWIAHVTVTEPVAYARYASAASDAFQKYGGRILARAGKAAGLEGEFRARNVAVEFIDFDAALTCYHSPEYQQAKSYRVNAGEVSLVILEGVEDTPATPTMPFVLEAAET